MTRPSVWRAEKSKTPKWLRPPYVPSKITAMLLTQDSTTSRGTGDRRKIRVESGCKLTSSNEWPWHKSPHRGLLTRWRSTGWRHTSCRPAKTPRRGNITRRTDKIRCGHTCMEVHPNLHPSPLLFLSLQGAHLSRIQIQQLGRELHLGTFRPVCQVFSPCL